MLLSRTTQVALRAIAYIVAMQDPEKGISARDLATVTGANPHTVAKAMQTLVRQGVVSSSRGPAGGFFVSFAQQKKTIMSIVEAIEGTEQFEKCVLGLRDCSDEHPCPIHREYKAARNKIGNIFNKTKIGDIPFIMVD
jgi:Rrf2 family protein